MVRQSAAINTNFRNNKENPLNFVEKRLSLRVDSQNLLTFTCCYSEGDGTVQGMGRTLNLSEGGILLESHIPLVTEVDVCLSIALEEDLMEFRGTVVHHRQKEDGLFVSGIRFTEMDEERLSFLRQYIILFTEKKKNEDSMSNETISFP